MKTDTKSLLHRITLAVLFIALLAMPLPVLAQGIIIDPPFPPHPYPPMPPVPPVPPVPSAISVEEYVVEAQVDGPAANVRVTQVFRNQTGATVEGQFIFPLPTEAAVSDFQMKVDDTVLEGKLLPSEEAKAIYEQIVRQQRDPALLQYIGQGLFQTNVFPIPPGEIRTVQLTYSELVQQEEGLYRFRYPLGAGLNQMGAQGGLRLRVELINQPGLRTVYSPNFGADVERLGADEAEVIYEFDGGAGGAPEAMFDLFWGTADSAIGVNLLSYRPVEEDGYFTLLVSPSVEETTTEVVARDLILVMDVSGSMEGEKMEQAREAANYLVDHLNPDDRFNLISFSTGVRLWSSGLESVDAAMIADAHEWIDQLDAGGSTDINRALLEALALAQGEGGASNRPIYILFMTDGLPTQGEVDPWRIMDNAELNAPEGRQLRLFTFGVGYDVNTLLLDTLSKELGGRSSYVQPEERINEAVSDFYAGISTPVLTNVELAMEGESVIDEMYPYPLPDLFAGEQLVVVGRYRTPGDVEVVLTGEINGKPQEFRYAGLELRERHGEPFVARLWATRKIGVLMEQVRREGPSDEVIDAIVELSLQYGIVTPYTAYLVEEPNMAGSVPQQALPDVPLGSPMPIEPGIGGSESAAAAPAAAADAYAQQEGERMAAMPASGAAAVAASEAQNRMQSATAVENAAQAQFIMGKTFVQQGWIGTSDGTSLPFWVDATYDSSMTVEWVLFGSDLYFELASDPQVGAWLSVGSEMMIVLDATRAVRISTNADEVARQGGQDGTAPVSPLPTPAGDGNAAPEPATAPTVVPTSQESEDGGGFWDWLWGR